MRRFFLLLVLLIPALARAATNYEYIATVTFTNVVNGVTNGDSITVNSYQRTYTNDVSSSPSTLILSTNVVGRAATNTITSLATYSVAGVDRVRAYSTNALQIWSAFNTTLTVSLSSGIGTVSYRTNVYGAQVPVLVPLEYYLAPGMNTNVASLLVLGIANLSTNAFAQSTAALSNFVSQSQSQTVGNKTLTNSTIDGGVLTNSTYAGTIVSLTGGTLTSSTLTNLTSLSGAIGALNGGVISNTYLQSSILTNVTLRGSTNTGPLYLTGVSNALVWTALEYANRLLYVDLTGHTRPSSWVQAGDGSVYILDNVQFAGNVLLSGTVTNTGTIGGLFQDTINAAMMVITNTGALVVRPRTISTLAAGVNIAVTATNPVIRFAGGLAGAGTIAGIAAGYDGQDTIHLNDESFSITYSPTTSDPVAGNRIVTPTSADVVVPAGGWAWLKYIGASSRWKLVMSYPDLTPATNAIAINNGTGTNTSFYGLKSALSTPLYVAGFDGAGNLTNGTVLLSAVGTAVNAIQNQAGNGTNTLLVSPAIIGNLTNGALNYFTNLTAENILGLDENEILSSGTVALNDVASETTRVAGTNALFGYFGGPATVISGTDIDWAVSQHRFKVLTSNTTFTASNTNLASGVSVLLFSDGGGPYTATFWALDDQPGGAIATSVDGPVQYVFQRANNRMVGYSSGLQGFEVRTNGVSVSTNNIINLLAGSNVSILATNGAGGVTHVAFSATGGGGAATNAIADMLGYGTNTTLVASWTNSALSVLRNDGALVGNVSSNGTWQFRSGTNVTAWVDTNGAIKSFQFGAGPSVGTDIAGQSVILHSGQGTGTGAGGNILFQIAPAGSAGAGVNALATVGTLTSSGAFTITGNLTANGFLGSSSVQAGTANHFVFLSRTRLGSPADGQLLLSNNGVTDFSLLQFGGTTRTFSAISRTGAGFTILGADGVPASTNNLIVPGRLSVTNAIQVYAPTIGGDQITGYDQGGNNTFQVYSNGTVKTPGLILNGGNIDNTATTFTITAGTSNVLTLGVSNVTVRGTLPLLLTGNEWLRCDKAVADGTGTNFVVDFSRAEWEIPASGLTNIINIVHLTNGPTAGSGTNAFTALVLATGPTNRHIYFPGSVSSNVYGTNTLTTILAPSNEVVRIPFEKRTGLISGYQMGYPIW